MDEVKAYCMKCKTERVVQDAHVVTTKNGRRAAQGTCPVCGTKMFKFLPKLTQGTAEPVQGTAEPVSEATPTETVPAPTPAETAPAAPPTEPAPMG